MQNTANTQSNQSSANSQNTASMGNAASNSKNLSNANTGKSANNLNSQNTAKKTLFSGIQPTGVITLGNYLGAIKNWGLLQKDYNCYFCVVDMHSITVRQEPAVLRKKTLELFALYIACGLNPQDCTLFIQSHVPGHAQLMWVLGCISSVGELSRMTQFKDKSRTNADNINMGLMSYPVLMAADILLYNADIVPVGADQKQHLELSRDLAMRFNNRYSPTFTVPEPYIPQQGARIMSLQNPLAKMSKTDDNINGFVALTDSKDDIMRKFRRAVTDSGSVIKRGEGKEGIENLLTIYSCITGKTIAASQQEFEGKGYGEFKERVAEVVIEEFTPVWDEYYRLIKDKSYLMSVVESGAQKASAAARKTIGKVYRKTGFVGF